MGYSSKLTFPITTHTNPPEQLLILNIPMYFQFFVLDVIINFKRLSDQDLVSQLKRIADIAAQTQDPDPVGLLTTGNRSEWAASRFRLMEGEWVIFFVS